MCITLASSPAYAVDQNRLWLPVRYQTLYLSLVKAASVAEELERCVTVVEGTLDLEQSTPDHPIYKILCRQESGRTYNEMVDGLSFVPLTTPPVVEPVLTPEELERQRVLEEERRQQEITKQKQDAWQLCLEQLLHRTRLMLDLVWLDDIQGQVEPEYFSEEEVRFRHDFDARSMWREPLHYRAVCKVAPGGNAEVVLQKR